MDAVKLFARGLGDMSLGVFYFLVSAAFLLAVPFEVLLKALYGIVCRATAGLKFK